MADAHAELVASGKRLRRSLLRLNGRRGKIAARGRTTLQALIASNRKIERMQIPGPGFANGLWKALIQERSVVRVEATRQIIRGSRARVYLRLTLHDGSTIHDSEPLVLHRGRWLLG